MRTPPVYHVKAPDVSGIKGSFSALRSRPDDTLSDPVGAIVQGIQDGNSLLGFLKVVAYWVARGIILPAELFFRTRLGERYVALPVPLICFGLIAAAVVMRVVLPNQGWLFAGAVLGGLLFDRDRRTRAQRAGVHWHSYSDGVSWLNVPHLARLWTKKFGPFSTVDVAKNILEPVAIFLALVLVSFLSENFFWYLTHYPARAFTDYPQCLWLLTVLIVDVWYQYYCMRVRRGRLLDFLDAQLMRDAYREASDIPKKGEPLTRHGVASMPQGGRRLLPEPLQPRQIARMPRPIVEAPATIPSGQQTQVTPPVEPAAAAVINSGPSAELEAWEIAVDADPRASTFATTPVEDEAVEPNTWGVVGAGLNGRQSRRHPTHLVDCYG